MSWHFSPYLVVCLVLGWFPATSRADLRFQQPTVDVDVVRSGQRLVQEFPFINAGPEPVEVLDFRTSCGCLTPTLEKRLYQPGQAGTLRVEANTLGQPPGPHTWTVRVVYRAGAAEREMPLQVLARILTEVSVQPATLSIFADQALSHEISVTDLRPKPLTIALVQASSPKIAARVADQGRDAQGRWTWKVRFELAADYPDGRRDEVIAIVTDDPIYPELKVPVTIVKRLRQRVSALPAQVTLTARAGQPIPSQLVRLRDGDDQQVVVERITAGDPAVTCTWAPGPNQMATLKIQVDRARLHGDGLQSAVQVELRRPVPQTITIPVLCQVE